MKASKKQLVSTLLCAIVLLLVPFLMAPKASAAKITGRTLFLGTSAPSAITTHHFQFTIPSSSSVGSIEFEYCINDPFIGTPCTAPAGLDLLTGTLVFQSGETGFIIDPVSTANRIVLSRASVPTTPGQLQYNFDNVTNPSTPNESVYVRLATFASSDGTGPRTDEGALVFSTSGSLNVSAFVPPYITFCVGLTVSLDCSSTTGNYLNLGDLSPNSPATGTSQMSAFTNDDTGYVITMSGITMTSGNHTISGLSSSTPSNTGTSQFGINLRDNALPDVGQEPAGVGTGSPSGDYALADSYKFLSGDTLASSALPTEPNVFTISYLVNIPNGQAPGVYTTTISYIGTAQF